MDDEQGLGESVDDSDVFQVQSPYQSDESRFSENSSYAFHEDPMDKNSYDDSEDESYYDMSTHCVDSTYESLPLLLNETQHELPSQSMVMPSVLPDICMESLEENNNDPNNNMDSIEVDSPQDPSIVTSCSSKNVIRSVRSDNPRPDSSQLFNQRPLSPRPGCSKDAIFPLTIDEVQMSEEAILERTRHILRLVSTIHRDSVFEAIKKNPTIPTGELKLSDLVPADEKFDYPPLDVCTNVIKRKAEDVNVIVENCSQQNESMPMKNIELATTSTVVKRGPVEDMCTISCKKSSSDSDISMSLPKIPVVPLTTSKIPMRKIAVPTVKAVAPVVRPRCEETKFLEKTLHKRSNVQNVLIVDSLTSNATARTVVNVPPKRSVVQISNITVNNSKGAIPKIHADIHKQYQQQQYQGIPVECVRIVQQQKYNSIPQQELESARTDIRDTDKNVAKPSSIVLPLMNVITKSAMPSTNQKQNIQPQQSQQRLFCSEMYYKLRNIFPNVDHKYIKKLCPLDWGDTDRDTQFARIVEYLLEKGDSLPPAAVKSQGDNNRGLTLENGKIFGNIDDMYETLLGIFPDADPHYLRDFSEKNVSNPNAVKEFVESKLENRDYPTREQYMAQLKITEQQRQYTTGFDIKQYLTIIPDPFKYFMDPNRKSTYSTVAFEFLKTYFNRIRVASISKMYSQFYYNLSRTAESLENTADVMKSKRPSIEIPTEDILLLQEIAFIKHKSEIRQHIANVKRVEDMEFQMMKEQNMLIECECCYDSECIPSKCSTCDNGHIFCNNCIITGTTAKIGEGETRIHCFVNCGIEFRLSVLQRVLAPTTFSILLKKRQAAEVIEAGLEGLVSCPFCHFSSIPPEEDKIFKCLNPECTKESCRLCKEVSHVPLKCDEVLKADKARHYIEEKMTQALARKCYKCQRAFFKEEGCNKITCPCGASMCYLCDQPITNYSHFRGQGSNDQNRCPLYSDTIRLNAVAVRKVAEGAQMEIMKMNPDVKIDTTKLLPDIPSPTSGPHRDVLNADQLPRRVHEIVDFEQL